MNTAGCDWLRRLPAAVSSSWHHGWTTSAGPDFLSPPTSPAHAAAVTQLVATVGLREGAWVQQVHGGKVIRAHESGYQGSADAVWTTKPGLGVIGRSADCPLILICGSDKHGNGLWGFAHASWRSTIAGITTNLLREMTAAGLRPAEAQAIICPSAGPCCYEVGPEVRQQALTVLGQHADVFFPPLATGTAFDLWQANCAQLEDAGLNDSQITVTGECTICGGLDFPSHRRQKGKAKRFAAISGGSGQPQPTNIAKSSRNTLNRYTAEHFTGDTLQARIARALCEAECLPRKEFYEAWETAKRVRRQMRGGPILELAAGHGLLAAILMILDDSSATATCVDVKQPPSHEQIMAVLVKHWPRLQGRIRFVKSRLEEIEVPTGSLIVSVHACGILTDRVLDLAIKNRSRVAVLPCCHDLRQCDTGSLANWMDGPLAVDATRAARLQQAGFKVQTARIPAEITPKNRLLLGWPTED